MTHDSNSLLLNIVGFSTGSSPVAPPETGVRRGAAAEPMRRPGPDRSPAAEINYFHLCIRLIYVKVQTQHGITAMIESPAHSLGWRNWVHRWALGMTLALLPGALLADPGSALQFDGASGYVQVPNNASLNAFPFTVSAWFRTTNSTGIRSIASKYVDGSGNGWFLMVQNGFLRGYYSASLFSTAVDATSAASVADGFWHHACLVVDRVGGRLYLDGVQVGSGSWVGVPGAPTTTAPLQFGRYDVIPNRFSGALDEITLWNRALGIAEVNYLKHRHLNGNEDGLLGLWHFDESAGNTASDATGHGFTGNLISTPAWVISTAPIAFHQVAGTALKYDGVNGYVQVAHTDDLNGYPFTATAWFRTTNTTAVQGLVSKYVDSSANGWTLVVQGGHLRAFYYRNGSFLNRAIDATSAVSVADGAWHHAALAVDDSGGRLFLDGAVIASSAWLGAPGPQTGTDLLQIGHYSTYTDRFQGAIDEVTVWGRALANAEVPALMNVPLAGAESGLTAYWRFDEGAGATAADATGLGHTGTLVSSPVWIGSTAFLGDRTSVIHTTLGSVRWVRQFAVQTIPGESGFAAAAPFWVRRLDDFGAAGGTTNVSVTLQAALQSALLAGPVPLTNNVMQFNLGLTAFNAAAPQVSAGGVIQSPVLDVEPQPGTQLDSVNDSLTLSVAEAYAVNGGSATTGETLSLAPTPLLHFNGNLSFGSIPTVFTSLANVPSRGALAGGGISTVLAVNNNGGYLASKPDHTYGDGTPLNAVLLSNGDAISSTTVTLNGPTPDTDCIQNICFQRTSLNLSTNGASGFLVMTLPAGFSVGIDPSYHLTLGALEYANTALDANLQPTSISLDTGGPLYGVQETLPYWFAAPSLTWLVSAGQIQLNVTSGVFVRQVEDDALTSLQPTLNEPNSANRVSNDGYFRNAQAAGLLTVTADANGAARVTTQLTLNPPELRPHFPYSGSAAGNQIQTAPGGVLAIADTLVDTVNSHLVLLEGSIVPVAYARDCEDATNCSSGQAGPGLLAFTPSTPNQLAFTLDGGLFSFGAVPKTNLDWGYVGGTNFAQEAGTVQSGAYTMAGTFLRGDQSSQPAYQLPAVVLFSGFGNDSDPSYLERPGDPKYAKGFANYPGVNFRAPASGRSFLAKQDTGVYPLNPVSKYYARFGGISGIHQAATFPSKLGLYGYNFTFTRFAMSFLDSENWESRTDGGIAFPPQPAGFTQPFNNMLITCRGDLSSAQIPDTTATNHLNYWNVDFTPQSMDFHPTNNDACGTSTRFLVLGAETKLPFIPQALHAALGFKPNGNLVTPADHVVNVDSRFPVPATLSLQGPGTTLFTFSTAAEGYFNNWETPGRPDAGFYNLAGKLRVPFFSDVKTHLQVTPTGHTTSKIDIMGGWPAADSSATDLGWSVGGSNYFNAVKFDARSDGWPAAQAVALTDYRRSSSTQYRPRAQRDWIEVAIFDYPLQWDTALHRFTSFQDSKVVLPVIDVNSRLKELAPGKVDFDFAQDIDLQLPRIKVLDFVNDALNGNIGPLVTVSNAIRQELGAVFDATGLNGLSQMLREDAKGFFDPVLGATLDPLVNNTLYPQLAALSQVDRTAFLSNVYQIVTAPSGALQNAITDLNGATSQANSVIGQVNKTLTDVEQTAGLFNRVLEKDGSGNRHVVRTIIQKLVQDQGPELGFIASLADTQINPLLTELDASLNEIQSDIHDVSNQLAQVQAQLGSVTGDFSQALGAAIGDATGMSDFLKSAGTDLTNYLASVLTPAGDFFTSDPAAARKALREELETAFLASALPGNYQKTFRDFLYDKDFLLDQLMDAMFDQINRAIRDALTSQISGAKDGLFQNMKGGGLMSGSLLSAKIRGAPTFDGDSLRKIHLDAAIKLNLPDEMDFNAYMDIKELDSQTVPLDCIPAGAPAAEITLGAKDIPLSWAGVSPNSPLTLTVEARWTVQSGSVLGIGGLFDIKGEAGFEGCSIKEIGASLAIGQLENYFAAKAAGSILILGIPVDVHAGLFAGHACTLDPLKFIDSEADQVLASPTSFSGVYIEYGGGVSLSEILGLGSSCFLDVEASETTALYWEGGPRFGTIGGRQKMAIDVSLLCLVSGHVDWATFIQISAGKFVLGASADVCGSIGPCPFCVSGCKGITVKGILTPGGIDYSIDY